MKYIVLEDCMCEHCFNEIVRKHREIKPMYLKHGDIVELISESEFSNFYGNYLRVKKAGNDHFFDIQSHKLAVFNGEYDNHVSYNYLINYTTSSGDTFTQTYVFASMFEAIEHISELQVKHPTSFLEISIKNIKAIP